MLFNVPQFIDIEDKIVGPLTAKQLGWLAIGGVIMLVLFNYLDNQALIPAAIIISVVFGALAFYRPYNQPLVTFIFSSISFLFRPKIYIWRRFSDNIKKVAKTSQNKGSAPTEKKKNYKKITDISNIVDKIKKY